MATITREFQLYTNAGSAIPPVIHVNQYDRDEIWLFKLYEPSGQQFIPTDAAIVGIKADDNIIANAGTVAGGIVRITETEQMTAAPGKAVFEILLDGDTHGTANFIVMVEPSPTDDGVASESDLSLFQQAIDSISPAAINAAVSAWMSAQLTPSQWVIDNSLTVANAAADAKVTGDALNAKVEMNPVTNLDHYWRLKTNDPLQVTIIPDKGEIDDLKSQINRGSGLTEEIKQALMNIANNVAWEGDDPTGKSYIDALQVALWPPANLTSITAVYTQSGAVYDTADLNSLKTDLAVTANYDDGTSESISNYELSGTLTEGTSTITVSYGDKTTTFTVTVTASPLPAEYTAVPWVASLNTGTNSNNYGVNTGVTPSSTGTLNIQIGFMLTATATEGQYFIAANSGQGSGGQIGAGVYGNTSNNTLGAYNGIGGSSIELGEDATMVNQYYDIIANFTSNSSSITYGTETVSATGSARSHGKPIWLFGNKYTNSEKIANPAKGRIYYAKVSNNDNLILDLIPCTRNSDGQAGFYDVVHSNFITGDNLTAGE